MGGLFGGLHGKVTKVGAGSITVSTGAGAARTFKTTSSTKYFTMTTPSTRTDVKVGDEIAVVPAFAKGTPETVHASLAGTVTARAVVVVEPFTTGTVVSVSSDQFVVRNAGGLLRDVVVSASSTKYSEGGTSINGVKKGERIFAYGAAATDPTKLDATNVLVIGPRVVGVVKSISGNVITLTGPGGTTSVTTTSSTTFKKGRTTSSLSAVTKGDVLSAIGTRTNGTFEANAVVFGARPAPRFAAPGSPGPGDSAAGS